MSFLVSCQTARTIDLGDFKITVPRTWKYVEQEGVDSFVGKINGRGITLKFDYSERGYAGTTVLTPDEYILVHIAKNYFKAFNEPGVRYTRAGEVAWYKNFDASRMGITDTASVKVLPIIRPEIKIMPVDSIKAEYRVELYHKDSTISFKIHIPEELTRYYFKIDTVSNVRTKLYWPKVPGQGQTGVYFKELNSDFDFVMYGDNLDLKKQDQALDAFTTIRFKRK